MTGRRTPQVVSFDGDGTLWDFEAAMAAALADTAEWLTGAAGTADAVTGEWLRAVRDEVAARPEYAGARMEDIRIAAFRESVRRLDAPPALADRAYDRYMAVRFARIEAYPEVRGVLAGLAADGYRLALVTNGNTYPERIGMAGVFEAVVVAGEVGKAKPDPAIYRHALDLLGAAPGDCLHIGDGPENDVVAARRAGLDAAWLDRDGAGWPLADGGPGVPVLTTLAEVPALLAG